MASNSFQHHFDMILAKLQDSNPYSQVLAYLVARALLSRLSGEHQIDAARRILEAMQIESLGEMGAFMNDVSNLEVVSKLLSAKQQMLRSFSSSMT